MHLRHGVDERIGECLNGILARQVTMVGVVAQEPNAIHLETAYAVVPYVIQQRIAEQATVGFGCQAEHPAFWATDVLPARLSGPRRKCPTWLQLWDDDLRSKRRRAMRGRYP